MGIKELYFSCNKVLPLVYSDALSYYEVLCKVTEKLNSVIKVTNAIVDELGTDLVTEVFDNETDVKSFMKKANIGKSFKYVGVTTNVLISGATYKVISNLLKTGDIISNERVYFSANAVGATKEINLIEIKHNGNVNKIVTSSDGDAYGYIQGSGTYFENYYDEPTVSFFANNISGCVITANDDRFMGYYADRQVYTDKTGVTLKRI